jgi:hypothetical protein
VDCCIVPCSCAHVANTATLPNLSADPMDQHCCNMLHCMLLDGVGSSCAAIYVQVQAGYCNCCQSTCSSIFVLCGQSIWSDTGMGSMWTMVGYLD